MDTLDAWPIGEDPRVTAHSSFSAKRSSHHVSCRPGCSLNFLRLERHSKQNRVSHLDVRCARRYIICRQIVWRLFGCRAINPVTTARLVVRAFTIHHHAAPLPPAPQLANSHSPILSKTTASSSSPKELKSKDAPRFLHQRLHLTTIDDDPVLMIARRIAHTLDVIKTKLKC
jgi:hypothetical protein